MIILVPTIPHTGTKLLANEILRDFEHNALINTPKNRQKVDDHIYPEKMTRWKELLKEYPAIIPLRNPVSIAVSWERRNKDLGELMVMWYILVEQIDQFNPHYLPIDVKGRDYYLDRINKQLRLELYTDWPVINSVHNSLDVSINELSIEGRTKVLRMIRNTKEFVDRFYG
jgi:hypothetical protein